MAERQKKATIAYLLADGTEAKSVSEEVTGLRFDFEGGQNRTLLLNTLPQGIVRIAAVRGVAEKIRDGYAGSESVGDAIESAESIIEQLVAGDWSAERAAAGPRPSMVVDAIIAALTKAGQTVERAAVEAKYTGKGTEAARKAALALPQVRAEFESLRAAAAAKRAEEAAAAASKPAAEGAPSLASLV